MKNPIINNYLSGVCLTLLSLSSSQAAWIWSDFGTNPTGASGSASMTPVSANYDGGNGVNGFGWDTTPEPFILNWAASTDVTLDLVFRAGTTILEYLEIKANDPSVTSFDLTLDVIFPFRMAVRADPNVLLAILGNGGLAMSLNPIGLTVDRAKLLSEFADGTPVALNQATTGGATPSIDLYGTVDNAIGDEADFGNISTGWHGLESTLTNATHFAWPTVLGDPTDPAKGLGRQTWTLEGVNIDNSTDVLRFSFDGGVPEGALATSQIPEPSSTILMALASLVLIGYRKNRI